MNALRINTRTPELQDGEIVHRILQGEKALFEILVRRYNQRLYRVVRSYLTNQEEVQDAMQNAYLKAYDKLHQFQGNSSFSTWLIRIAINEALLRLKDLKRVKVISINADPVDSSALNQIPDHQMNGEKQIMRGEAKELFEKAVDALPENFKTVYILKEVEGLPSEEVCEILGLTDSNMKVRLHRAKAMLKESLYQLTTSPEIFEFGNRRCDAVVNFVMNNLK